MSGDYYWFWIAGVVATVVLLRSWSRFCVEEGRSRGYLDGLEKGFEHGYKDGLRDGAKEVTS